MTVTFPTSSQKCNIRYQTSQIAADEPFDTAHALKIANNANHLADSYAQVRVGWEHSGSYFSGIPGKDTNNGYQLVAPPQGPFPLSIRPDGKSYKIRVQAKASTWATGDVTNWRLLVACTPAQAVRDKDDASRYVTFQTSTTTPAWSSAQLIQLSSGQLESTTWSDPDSLGVQFVMAHLYVYALTTNSSVETRLYGLYAAEYIGTS